MRISVLLILTFLCSKNSFAQIVFSDNAFFSVSGTYPTTWNQPVGLAFSSTGDKLFVWEKAGKVYVCNRDGSGNYIRQAQAVIDLSAEVGNYNDYGLTGFALDPDFATNGKIYLFYVVDRKFLLGLSGTPDVAGATIGRITQYTTSTSGGVLTANAGSRNVLLGETKETGLPILYLSHGTGSLVFAADGTLLASMGDGAGFDGPDEGSKTGTFYQDALTDGIIRPDENVGVWRSQMLTSLNGKILRIDPETGEGIVSNPFFEPSAPGSTKSKIWAMGLRNPFRISLKPGVGSPNRVSGHIGELFIGDVGFGDWEELDIATDKGMNFGWPKYEGFRLLPDGSPTAVYLGNKPNEEYPFPPSVPDPCGLRDPAFARFKEILREDNEAKDSRVYYCGNSANGLMAEGIQHIHARPVLDWLHADNNDGPMTRVGTFDASGAAIQVEIGGASGVTGSSFNGNASTGGIWYTGNTSIYPAEYANTFFFCDYGGGWIKRATFDHGRLVRVDDFASNTITVCMAENPADGSIFYIDYSSSGTVNKINYGGNKPPVAKVSATPYYTDASTLSVPFDGSASYDPDDPDGDGLTYVWDFGDGSPTGAGLNPTHLFTNPTPGTPRQFNVKLTVTDIGGATGETIFVVSLDNTPPVVTITQPVNNSKYPVGGNFTQDLRATVNDAENNIIEYEWQAFMLHNTHNHAGPAIYEEEATTIISGVGCDGEDYSWLIRLKVTDGAGLFTIDSTQIYPNCTLLPLVLSKFSVTQNSSNNLVKWTTELESGIEYFEVERSSDGRNFSPLIRQAARNEQGPNHYSFTDDSFLPGVNYYRLKIVETDNVIKYSVIIRTVSEGEKIKLKVVPNPVVNNFSVVYQSAARDRVTLQIKDMNGRTIRSMTEEVQKGQNIIYIQNLPNWLSGVYIISVQNRSGIEQAKFIKLN